MRTNTLHYVSALVVSMTICQSAFAQTSGPGPGFPGNGNPIILPPTPPATPPPRHTPWIPHITGELPYNGWNQYYTGYNPNAGAQYRIPCPGDILIFPRIAPSKPGNYKGGTFGMTRAYPGGVPKMHNGLDLLAVPGTPFPAAYGGTVTRVERNFAPGQYAPDSYGNFVEIRSVINGQVVYLSYNHMDAVNILVQPGAVIRQGAPIGLSGKTGNAADRPHHTYIIPHVHIKARDENGNKLNPETYISTKFNHATGESTGRPC